VLPARTLPSMDRQIFPCSGNPVATLTTRRPPIAPRGNRQSDLSQLEESQQAFSRLVSIMRKERPIWMLRLSLRQQRCVAAGPLDEKERSY